MIQETIQQIEARLIATLQSDKNLYDIANPDTSKRGLTSVSQVAKWRVFLNTVATEIFTLQQLMGIFQTETEGIINGFAPATELWIQKRVFEFQYGSVLVLDLVTLIPAYNVIDTTLRIVTNCSVNTNKNKTIDIKVAKGGVTPAPLVTLEKTALKAYLDTWLDAGVDTNIISLVSDKMAITAQVFYNGQFAETIQADVIAALNAFLLGIPFDGVVKVSAIEDAIQAVAGVTDIIITQVKARDDNTPFSGATIVTKEWVTFAGYIIQETTGGQTFADTLTFTVQN